MVTRSRGGQIDDIICVANCTQARLRRRVVFIQPQDEGCALVVVQRFGPATQLCLSVSLLEFFCAQMPGPHADVHCPHIFS